MKITRISQTKRGRFALFAEEEFLFSVDEETLAKNELREGSSISDGELSLLKAQSETRKAKDQALRYLSLRAYAEKELYAKLCLKYDEHSSAAAVAEMRALDLLDDMTFAVERAKGLALRNKSSLEISRQLSSLGIGQEDVEEALWQAEVDDTQAALAVLRKMYITKLEKGEIQKVKAALARRGFSHADINRAIDSALSELDEEGVGLFGGM